MTPPNENGPRLGASFRDPSGFLFERQGILYRQVNQVYRPHFEALHERGLYERLVNAGLLIPHQDADVAPAEPELAYRVIRPERVDFISYPYEWCFSQLKDAALATMAIQKQALEAGMLLKDASAYNIQFHHGRPVLIDSLSFEIQKEGEPWVAYRQFCQHFLAPLALMAHVDVRLGQLLRIYIDGVPLDLAARLLPRRTRLDLGLATHIHLHAAAQKRYSGRAENPRTVGKMSRMAFLGLMDSLETAVRKLTWKPAAPSGAITTPPLPVTTPPRPSKPSARPCNPASSASSRARCGIWAPTPASSAAWQPGRASPPSPLTSIRRRLS